MLLLNPTIGILLGIVILILSATGAFRESRLLTLSHAGLALCLLLVLAKRLSEGWASYRRGPNREPFYPLQKAGLLDLIKNPGNLLFKEAEIGTLLLALLYMIGQAVQPGNGAFTPVFALTYILFCFMGAMAFYWQNLVYWGLLVLSVEIGTYLSYDLTPFSPYYLVAHLLFILVFAASFRLFLFRELVERRSLFQKQVTAHIKGIHDHARLFRLNPGQAEMADASTNIKTGDLRLISSVEAVKESLHSLFDLSALGFSPPLHALLLFVLDDDHFILSNAVSNATSLVTTPIPAGRGIFGVVKKNRKAIFLTDIPQQYNLLCYYRFPEKITDLAALPIMWEGGLLGVLIADRLDETPFSKEETWSLNTLLKEITRLLSFERVFSRLLRQKRAHEKFHRLAHEFNRAMGIQEVAKTAITATQDICDAQFAALTCHEAETGRNIIIAADWKEAPTDDLTGRILLPDAGLVAKVVKLGHPLPESPVLTPHQVIFDPTIPLPGLSSVKIFPLQWDEKITGTLVVGDPALPLSSRQTQKMLEVIAGHSAIALAQALLYEQLERMATTDGLTGLINHRYFQEQLKKAFHRAERYKRQLTLAIIDLDHFKQINDRYGHPAGDVILQEIARHLYLGSRQTDIVARYGGEEFAIIMDETHWKDAFLAVERLRESVAQREFSIEGESLHCTLSIGLANYPEHARDKNEIIKFADQALYQAKHNGRNRVEIFSNQGERKSPKQRGGAVDMDKSFPSLNIDNRRDR